MNKCIRQHRHIPVIKLSETISSNDMRMSQDLIGFNFFQNKWFCYFCKKPIRAYWKVKDESEAEKGHL